jgi:hypothetical protein
MANEFLKSLISLLASSGGSASLPLSDLTQLGVELSLSDLGSDSCILRLRLGPKIYWVPDKQANPKGTTAPSEEAPWPTTPAPAAPSPEPSLSTLDAEITAVNSLTNRAQRPPRPSRPPRLPRYIPPEELPPSPPSARESSRTEATRQELLTEPSSPPPQRRVIQKSDSDLLRTEQRQSERKTLAQAKRDREILRKGREYPWETRNSPPIKLQ